MASTPLVLALLVAPASADGPSDPISGLVGQLLGPPSSASAPSPTTPRTATASGSAWGFDGVLRHGCRDYPYRYAISTPTDEWTLEVFLRDRDGRNLASGTFISDSDPTERAARFRFCRYSTRPGWFTVRSLLHWYDADGTGHRQWLGETRFRLRRPR
ncbi:hypothetical protein GON03_18850 [Nocardioides sp. MAH-18]|uniref:Uncharacterized protein n=1 Tax=Nocardioides agri TaxID=2682843 RepID=A0A6L6Y106_9ACTN|nr:MULTISPECIES: hypothetical protein [unclassified Nocardioides]MBA2952075.1 hypothetical protein [Nocardioides sp. CGMCC 1.13656]MVQ51245.1 hypothetical protein [Nocardioides sp. MAH-18]